MRSSSSSNVSGASAVGFRHASAHFLRRQILFVSGNGPGETEGILHMPIAVTPELIGERELDGAASRDRLLKGRVRIRHIHVQDDGPIALRNGRAAKLGETVGEHKHGIADANLSVHQLGAWSGVLADECSVERLLEKFDVLGCAVDRQVRCQRVKARRDRICRFCHNTVIIKPRAATWQGGLSQPKELMYIATYTCV